MGTVMEHTLGKAIENIAKGAAEQMQAAQEQAEELQRAATLAIKANSQLRQQLGPDLQVAPPISQSSSMQIDNGRQIQTVESSLSCCG